MKLIYLTSFIIIFVLSPFINAQQKNGQGNFYAVNDTLMFDGEGNANFFNRAFNDCTVEVHYIKGNATGTRIYSYTETVCGGQIDTVNRMEKGKVKKNDKLKAGDLISTGPNTYMTIKLSDGKIIRFSPNTSLSINENYCKDNSRTFVDLKEGEIYADDRPGNKNKSINVTTKYGAAIVEGTQFTIGTQYSGNDTVDVLKVYEGSVKFRMVFSSGANKKTADLGAEMKKAYDDYQSGKITANEYAQKIQDLQKGMTENTPKEAITVNAGYQSKIINAGNPSEPENIDANEPHWWEDSNFK